MTFTAESVAALSHFFQNENHLQNFTLSNAQLPCALLELLATWLKKNPRIERLNLSHNTIQENDSATLTISVGRFFDALREHRSLRELSLASFPIVVSYCAKLVAALHKSKILNSLNLSGNNFSQYDCGLIAGLLKDNHALQTLVLANCQLSDAAASVLMCHIADSTLCSLDLSANVFSYSGAKAIAEGLARNTSLVTLDVTDCFTSEIEVKTLVASLARNSTLLTLVASPSRTLISALGRIDRQKPLSLICLTMCLSPRHTYSFRGEDINSAKESIERGELGQIKLVGDERAFVGYAPRTSQLQTLQVLLSKRLDTFKKTFVHDFNKQLSRLLFSIQQLYPIDEQSVSAASTTKQVLTIGSLTAELTALLGKFIDFERCRDTRLHGLGAIDELREALLYVCVLFLCECAAVNDSEDVCVLENSALLAAIDVLSLFASYGERYFAASGAIVTVLCQSVDQSLLPPLVSAAVCESAANFCRPSGESPNVASGLRKRANAYLTQDVRGVAVNAVQPKPLQTPQAFEFHRVLNIVRREGRAALRSARVQELHQLLDRLDQQSSQTCADFRAVLADTTALCPPHIFYELNNSPEFEKFFSEGRASAIVDCEVNSAEEFVRCLQTDETKLFPKEHRCDGDFADTREQQRLIDTLWRNPYVETLTLASKTVPESIFHMLLMAKALPMLKHLHLSDHQLDMDHLHGLLLFLENQAQFNQLTIRNSPSPQSIIFLLQELKSSYKKEITRLSLINVGLIDPPSVELVSRSLISLELDNNQLTAASAPVLLTYLEQLQLQRLSLRGNRLGDAAIESLLPAIAHHTALMSLDLSATGMSNRAATKLVTALRLNFSITTILIDENEIDESLIVAIRKIIERNLRYKDVQDSLIEMFKLSAKLANEIVRDDCASDRSIRDYFVAVTAIDTKIHSAFSVMQKTDRLHYEKMRDQYLCLVVEFHLMIAHKLMMQENVVGAEGVLQRAINTMAQVTAQSDEWVYARLQIAAQLDTFAQIHDEGCGHYKKSALNFYNISPQQQKGRNDVVEKILRLSASLGDDNDSPPHEMFDLDVENEIAVPESRTFDRKQIERDLAASRMDSGVNDESAVCDRAVIHLRKSLQQLLKKTGDLQPWVSRNHFFQPSASMRNAVQAISNLVEGDLTIDLRPHASALKAIPEFVQLAAETAHGLFGSSIETMDQWIAAFTAMQKDLVDSATEQSLSGNGRN